MSVNEDFIREKLIVIVEEINNELTYVLDRIESLEDSLAAQISELQATLTDTISEIEKDYSIPESQRYGRSQTDRKVGTPVEIL